MPHTEFEAAKEYVRNFKGLLPLKKQRALFGLEQQATVGDYTGQELNNPSTEEQKLLAAWAQFEGLPKEEAMAGYVKIVRQTDNNFNPNIRAETHPNLRKSYIVKSASADAQGSFPPPPPIRREKKKRHGGKELHTKFGGPKIKRAPKNDAEMNAELEKKFGQQKGKHNKGGEIDERMRKRRQEIRQKEMDRKNEKASQLYGNLKNQNTNKINITVPQHENQSSKMNVNVVSVTKPKLPKPVHRKSSLSEQAMEKNERMRKRLGYAESGSLSHSAIFDEQDFADLQHNNNTVIDTALVSESDADYYDRGHTDFDEDYEGGEVMGIDVPNSPYGDLEKNLDSDLRRKHKKIEVKKRSSLYSDNVLLRKLNRINDAPETPKKSRYKSGTYGSVESVDQEDLKELLKRTKSGKKLTTEDLAEKEKNLHKKLEEALVTNESQEGTPLTSFDEPPVEDDEGATPYVPPPPMRNSSILDDVEKQLKAFYFTHNEDMFKDSKKIRKVAAWAVKNGVDKLNVKLRKVYGEDLHMMMKRKSVESMDTQMLQEDRLDADVDKFFQETERNAKPKTVRNKYNQKKQGKSQQRFRRLSSEEIQSIQNETRLSRVPPKKFTPDNIRKVAANKMKKIAHLKRTARQRSRLKSDHSLASRSELFSSVSHNNEYVMDNRRFKKSLVTFLVEHEPDRIDYCLSKMVKFKQKKGLRKLNQNLKQKYGTGLQNIGTLLRNEDGDEYSSHYDRRRQGSFLSVASGIVRVSRSISPESRDLTEGDTKMLHLFFAKHDLRYVNEESIDNLIDWVSQNGVASLNRKLKKKYKEDLDEFSFYAEKLKMEIIEFYQIVDRTKLAKDFEGLVTWGIINGRDQLNTKLYEKYGVNLDSDTKNIQAHTFHADLL
eukprot:snap_masked-scaffold_7-processed-gene-17.19-mRNA-1 protein AED:1.00 eAED:1.00 QI:0/0/0/0/1/1/2/0/885